MSVRRRPYPAIYPPASPPPYQPPHPPARHGRSPYPQPPPAPWQAPRQAYRREPPVWRPPRAPATFTGAVHRLHWGTVPLGALYGFLIYLIFSVSLGILGLSEWLTSMFAAAVLTCGGALAGWYVARFRIEGDDLIVESGLLRRRRRRVPLSRLQAVDIRAPLIVRILGLAELRVELAGGDLTQVSFRYLARPVADRLRAELLAHAAGLDALTPEAPERGVYRVPFGTLLSSLLLKIPVLGSGVVFLALLVLTFVLEEPALLAGGVPALIALLRGVLSPLFQYGGCRIAISPDGLRVRYGLMAVRMQTMPPGRVHAVRILEPALWRPFGWVRLDATVAGYAGERAQASQVLLPVAPKRVAYDLVNWVFPGAGVEELPLVPARLGKRFRAAGANDAVFAVGQGVVRRSLDVIAHARVQSLRISSGPMERLAGAATVHLDPADGPIRVVARGRSLDEARMIVDSEAARARRARAARGPERWALPGPGAVSRG